MSPDATTGMDKYAGRLRMRLDEIFSEVCATLSPEFLDLTRGDRSVFAKLNSEYGISFDVDNSRNGQRMTIRGSLEQVILAKIKLERCVIVDGNHAGSPTDNDQDRPNSNHVMKLRKVKKEPLDAPSTDTPVSYVVMPDLRTPAISNVTPPTSMDVYVAGSTAALSSRRKRGRPRKIRAVEQMEVQAPSAVAQGTKLPNDFEAAENVGALSMAPVLPASTEIVVEPIVIDAYSLQETGSDGPVSSRPINDQQWIFENTQPREMSFDSYLQDARRKICRPQEELEASFKYSCELCSFKAEKEGQLLKHVLIHGKSDSVHKCDKCDFASVSLNHFQRHRLHHSDSLLHCPQCTFETDEAKLLSRHVALRHTLQLVTDSSMSDAEAQQLIARSSVLQCNECGYSTTKIYHFERHLLVHNRDLKGLLQVYQCEECAYKTHRKEHYVRHKENVHLKHRANNRGLHYCSYCGQSCRSVEALQLHLTVAHLAIGLGVDDDAAALASQSDPTVENSPADQVASCFDNVAENAQITVKLEEDNVVDLA